MNKIKYFIYLMLFVCIFSISSNIYAKEDVYIRSAELEEKSEGAIENNTIKYDGLDINLDLKFSEPNDYVKYKINIKNRTDKDYIISEENIKNISDYMTYDLSFDNDSDIVKAGANKIVYLTITYQNEVPEDKLVNTYQESKEFNLELLNEDGTAAKIENPKTGITSVIPMFVVMISGVVAFVVLRKYRKSKMLVLILLVSVLPLATYALETLTIDINSKVAIEKAKEFCVLDRSIDRVLTNTSTSEETDLPEEAISESRIGQRIPAIVYIKYRNGMTWEEFLNSKYNEVTDNTTIRYKNQNINVKEYNDKVNDFYSSKFEEYVNCKFENILSTSYHVDYYNYLYYWPNIFENYNGDGIRTFADDNYSKTEFLQSKIIDSSEGCYKIIFVEGPVGPVLPPVGEKTVK